MKSIVLSVLLCACLVGYAQKADTSAVYTVKKNTGLLRIQALAGIPLGYIVVSCNVSRTRYGEILKTYFNMNNVPAADAWFDRFLPNDIIYLDNIVVMKDGVKMKWPDMRLGSLNLGAPMLVDTTSIK